jgi:hypothetical protein
MHLRSDKNNRKSAADIIKSSAASRGRKQSYDDVDSPHKSLLFHRIQVQIQLRPSRQTNHALAHLHRVAVNPRVRIVMTDLDLGPEIAATETGLH